MEDEKYIEALEQCLTKRELAVQLFSRIYAQDWESLNKRMLNILLYTKGTLQSELGEALTNRSKNNYEKIEAITESAKREVILNYYISIFKELLKEGKENG